MFVKEMSTEDKEFCAIIDTAFRETFRQKLDGGVYRNARHIRLPRTATESKGVEEYANYTALTNSLDSTILDAAKALAEEAAGIVNSLIHTHTEIQNREILAADPFLFDDETPNLHFVIVRNPGPTVADPMEVMKGWVAYRFRFWCGYDKSQFEPSAPIKRQGE